MSKKLVTFIKTLFIIVALLILALCVHNSYLQYKQSQDEYYSFMNLYEEYRNQNWDGTIIHNSKHFAIVNDETHLIMIDYKYEDESGLYYSVDYTAPMESHEYVIKADDEGTYIIDPIDGTINYWKRGKKIKSWVLQDKNPSGSFYGYEVMFTDDGPYLSYNYVKLYKMEENGLTLISDNIDHFNTENTKIPSYIDVEGNVHDFSGQIDNAIYVPNGYEWVDFDPDVQLEYVSLHNDWKDYKWDGEFKITDDGLCVCVKNDVLFVNGYPESYFNYLYPFDYDTFLFCSSSPYYACSHEYFIYYYESNDSLWINHYEHGNLTQSARLPYNGKWKIAGFLNSYPKLTLLGSDENFLYDLELDSVVRYKNP